MCYNRYLFYMMGNLLKSTGMSGIKDENIRAFSAGGPGLFSAAAGQFNISRRIL